MIAKICTNCGVEKDIENFYKQKSGKYGVMSVCKNCWKEHIKNYRINNKERVKKIKKNEYQRNKVQYSKRSSQYYSENKEEILKRNAKWRNDHKEEKQLLDKRYRDNNKEKIKQKDKEKYYNHRDEKLQYASEYRKLNEDYIKDYGKKYRKSPIGKLRYLINNQKRRSKNKNLKNDLTLKQWDKILKRQNNCCDDCKKEFSENLMPTKDHIIPITNPFCSGLTFGNTRALCASCNSKKHTKVEFMRGIYELLGDNK